MAKIQNIQKVPSGTVSREKAAALLDFVQINIFLTLQNFFLLDLSCWLCGTKENTKWNTKLLVM